MKKTKKLLSLVLAILMVLAVSPMAFAYNVDLDTYVETISDCFIYMYNIYEPVGDMSSEDIRERIVEAYVSAENKVDVEYDFSWFEENPDKAEVFFKEMNAFTAKIEESIADGKLVVQVDSDNFLRDYIKACIVYEEELKILASSYEEADAKKIDDSFFAALSLLFGREIELEEVTQEMVDEAGAVWTDWIANCLACIEGKHELDYIVNEDGTHYSYCDFCKTENVEEHTFEDGRCVCGAEEPVIEDNTDTGASVSFIQRIIDFFRSLFDKILSLFK